MINAFQKPLTTPQTSDGFIGYVNGQIQLFATMELAQQAGATGIEPNYKRFPAGATTTQVVQPAQQTETQIAPENNLAVNAGETGIAPTGSNWFYYFAIALVILIALYGVYYFIKRKK